MADSNHDGRWDKIRDAVVDAVCHPNVRKVSRMAEKALEITAKLSNNKNPFSLAAAVVSSVEAASDALDLPEKSEIEHFVKVKRLTEKQGKLPKILVGSGIDKDFKVRVIVKSEFEATHLKEIAFDSINKMYYVESCDASYHTEDPTDKIYSYYFLSEGFNLSVIFDAIWKKFPEGIFIENKLHSGPHGQESNSVILNRMSMEDAIYIGEINPDDMVLEMRKFREMDISRSYMLAGPPGTGKTSLVLEVAKRFSSRILKVDSQALKTLAMSELSFMVENLAPDVLVFDDLDRAILSGDADSMLFNLEYLKRVFKKTVIFATVNHFEELDKAFVRPGRFDEIIWFELPNDQSRESLARLYLKRYGANASDESIAEIVAKTKDMPPVYIKELCIRIARKGFQVLDKTVIEFKRVLQQETKQEEKDSEEEFEISDDEIL